MKKEKEEKKDKEISHTPSEFLKENKKTFRRMKKQFYKGGNITGSLIEIEDKDIFLFVKNKKHIKSINLDYEYNSFSKDTKYKIFEFKFGVGQSPNFLFSNPHNKILEGEDYVYLEPISSSELEAMNPPEKEYLLDIVKRKKIKGLVESYLLGIKEFKIRLKNILEEEKESKENFVKKSEKTNEKFKNKKKKINDIINYGQKEELWISIILSNQHILQEENKPFFYKITSPLKEESLMELKEYDSDKLNYLVNYYLTENNKVDDRIIFLSRMNLFKFEHNPLKSKFIMPYNPHSIVQSNTKTSKSTTMEKVGLKAEKVSMSGLLGFSTGNETNIGTLDKTSESFTIDEVQEEKKQNLIQQTLSIMENGEAFISVGKRAVRPNTCSTLTFLTNPKELRDYGYDTKSVNLSSFENLLNILTDNYKAFGSRIGLVLFGNNFVEIKGVKLFSEDYIKFNSVVDCLREETSQEFTKLFLNPTVQEWCSSELPKSYFNNVGQSAEKILSKKVREFWLGHLEGHRHIRGGAFKLGCLDYISEIWNGRYDISNILEKSEEYLKKILSYNLDSLKEMVELSDKFDGDFHNGILSNLTPDYSKYLMFMLLRYYQQKPESFERNIVFDELRNVFNEISHKFESPKYEKWTELKNRFVEVKSSVYTKLINDLGVSIQSLEGVCSFKVVDMELFKQFLNTEEYKKIINVSLQVIGENGENGENGEKNDSNNHQNHQNHLNHLRSVETPTCKKCHLSPANHNVRGNYYCNKHLLEIMEL